MSSEKQVLIFFTGTSGEATKERSRRYQIRKEFQQSFGGRSKTERSPAPQVCGTSKGGWCRRTT